MFAPHRIRPYDAFGRRSSSAAARLDSTAGYHTGLRQHFALFDKVRLDYVEAPYPAWTAVEVAGLRWEGAVVEIRVIEVVDAAG